jgi:hypothetical protein
LRLVRFDQFHFIFKGAVMLNLRHVTHRIRIPTDIESILRPLLDRLLADDDDGTCLQTAIRPYFIGERPLVLIERGETTCLYVEGPWYNVGDRSFPLGAQLQTEIGWLDLTPPQAAELISVIAKSIDAIAFRWLVQERQLGKTQPARRARNRAIDDPLALRQMAAAARSTTQESREHHD